MKEEIITVFTCMLFIGALAFLKTLQMFVQFSSCRQDEAVEWWARCQRTGLEFRVVLGSNVVRVAGQFGNFHSFPSLIPSNQLESTLVDLVNIHGVDLIPMSVTFVNDIFVSIQLLHDTGRSIIKGWVSEFGNTRPKSHGSSHGGFVNLGHEEDNWMLGRIIKFGRVGSVQIQDVSAILHNNGLKSQTDSQVWLLVFTTVLGGQDFPLKPTIAKSSRDNDTLGLLNLVPSFFDVVFKVCCLHPLEIELVFTGNSSVPEGLDNGKIRILKTSVFSNQTNLNSVSPRGHAVGHGFPVTQIRRLELKFQL
mmetsp:Transcript_27825/g.67703  ORF Transcript_27825/g.67703 Transcript_27825/m.67703 type:complete len:307 (+) Transcript_27825:13-933(+)